MPVAFYNCLCYLIIFHTDTVPSALLNNTQWNHAKLVKEYWYVGKFHTDKVMNETLHSLRLKIDWKQYLTKSRNGNLFNPLVIPWPCIGMLGYDLSQRWLMFTCFRMTLIEVRTYKWYVKVVSLITYHHIYIHIYYI